MHARRVGLIDLPNSRSLHTRPTPRGGGIAIVAATLVGLLALPTLGVTLRWPLWDALIVGGSAIAAVSLADDVRGVAVPARLTVHLLAGALAVTLIGPIEQVGLPGFGVLRFGPLSPVLSVVWVAGLTNAFNFMDGIDGLAAGQATVAAGAWALVGAATGRADAFAVGLVLAGAAGGFLFHNWSPARLFMGDIGSAFLGYAFAVLSLDSGRTASVMPVVAVLLVWPFVFDPVLTLIRRAARGENLFAAHRSHLYQRLVAAGWGHRRVCVSYLWLGLLASVSGILLACHVPWTGSAVLIGMPLSVFMTWALVLRRERVSRVGGAE